MVVLCPIRQFNRGASCLSRLHLRALGADGMKRPFSSCIAIVPGPSRPKESAHAPPCTLPVQTRPSRWRWRT
jgi:hypothetical protein